MDIRKIKKLIDLLENSCVDEIEIKEGEESIRISRHQKQLYQPEKAIEYITTPPTKPESSVHASTSTATEDKVIEGHTITSPMVGTFYDAASPTSPAFCKVGDAIEIGAVLCIVEAMKVMNQIKSDKKGIIKAVLVGNGQPVEFDQPLFVIN